MDAIVHTASGVAGNDHFISSLQCTSGDALAAQRRCSAPLDCPTLHHALCIRRLNVDERMWISKIELDNLAGKLDLFCTVVGCSDGMMCVCRDTTGQD